MRPRGDTSSLEGNRVPETRVDGEALTLAFQRGEDGAYQAIYDIYSPRVYSVCRRMLGNPDDAQEASQETFLRAYQSLIRFNGRYELGAWITRIATNVCLDQLRARARRPAETALLEAFDHDRDGFTDLDGPEQCVVRDAESKRVRRVLAELPPLHRAAIVLRDFEGLSYGEVAIALNLGESQVKALLFRARQGFKKSWTAGAPLLFPVRAIQRVVQKLRGLESSSEHVAQVAGSGSQAAASCGLFLANCGQFVGERVATIVVAAGVGTAAVAGAATGINDHAFGPETRTLSAVSDTQENDRDSHHASRKEEPPAASETTATEEPSETTQTSTAEPEPSPSPSPSTTPGSSQSSDQGQHATQDDYVFRPLQAAVGFDRGQDIVLGEPASNEATVDCATASVIQKMEIIVTAGDESFPGLVRLDVDSSFGFELTVWKDGHEIYYTGGGPLISSQRSGNYLDMAFHGSFGTYSDNYEVVGLPKGGSFDASLSLDCTAGSVITERVVFAG
jgi:RNA polymerase sigma-70 factor (ECF subfamily)